MTGVGRVYNVNGKPLFATVYAILDMLGLASYLNTPTLNATWWYMVVAIFIVFLTPVITLIYKKIGRLLLVIAFFLPTFLTMQQPIFSPYFFSLVMGVCAAEEGLFELYAEKLDKLKRTGFTYVLGHLVALLLLIGMLVYLLYLRNNHDWKYIIDGIIPLILCDMCMSVKVILPVMFNILKKVGEYSMNIFFAHTFLYFYFGAEYVYWTNNWFVIFCTLLLYSFALSYIIEKIKKTTRYYEMLESFTRKLNFEATATRQ